ncbi:hypothetical protein NL676_029548 [Syzygium grande]|nr:hypothetical protein NL676_029548 [Syzygium grande]
MTRLQFIGKTVASSNEWSAAREFGCFVTSLVRSPPLRRNWSSDEVLLIGSQRRFMTTSKRVQDRSENKRVHDLEIAAKKHKVVVPKVLVLMEMLKKEPEMIIPVRREFGLPADFRSKWVHEYPQHFKVVKSPDEVDYLELVEWNPASAITELEKAVLGVPMTEFLQEAVLYIRSLEEETVRLEKLKMSPGQVITDSTSIGVTLSNSNLTRFAITSSIRQNLVTGVISVFDRQRAEILACHIVAHRGSRRMTLTAAVNDVEDCTVEKIKQDILVASVMPPWPVELLDLKTQSLRKYRRANRSCIVGFAVATFLPDNVEVNFSSVSCSHCTANSIWYLTITSRENELTIAEHAIEAFHTAPGEGNGFKSNKPNSASGYTVLSSLLRFINKAGKSGVLASMVANRSGAATAIGVISHEGNSHVPMGKKVMRCEGGSWQALLL